MDNIILLAAGVTMFTKVLVDMVSKFIPNLAGWITLLSVLIFANVNSILLMLSMGTVLNIQTVSTAILVAILASGSAVGVTELQKSVQRDKQKEIE